MPRTEAQILAMLVTLQLLARENARFPGDVKEIARRTLENIGEGW